MEFAADSDTLLQLRLATELWSPPSGLFFKSSDPLLRLALYSGFCAIAVSVALLVTVLVLRLILLVRQRRIQRFVAAWRPLMAQCLESVPASLPALAPADRDAFFRLWNHYHESLRGVSKDRLNQLAVKAGMDIVARAMLSRRSLGDRLVAVVTLGHLGDKTAWHELRRLAEDESPLLSLAAAGAMLRIETASTLQWLLPLAAARRDWALSKVAAMLAEAGVDRVTPALAMALDTAITEGAADRQSRLLRLAGIAHSERLRPAVRRILEHAGDEDVIADALGALRDPRDADLARRHAMHSSWIVRVAVAKALGRVGTPADRALLTDMLSDASWWVRYRSARSLAGLPFVRLEELKKIRAVLPDPFAAQALDHAIAEMT